MRRSALMLLLLLGAALFSGCGISTVSPGYVGVKVSLYGDEKGVSQHVVGTGRYWLTYNENMYLFPTFMQNYTWTKSPHEGNPEDESITFQSKEGLAINGDFGISYEINAEKVATIFQKYRKGVEEITNIYLRNHVRDALNTYASTMSVDQIYGEGKVSLINQTQAYCRKQVQDIGIIVDKVYLIGDFRLPEQVQNSLNAKIQADQDALKAKSQAIKKIVLAEAEARSNRLVSESITSSLIMWEKIKKWDGVNPLVVSSNGGSGIFVDMKDAMAVHEKAKQANAKVLEEERR